jgi:hypothetical protein
MTRRRRRDRPPDRPPDDPHRSTLRTFLGQALVLACVFAATVGIAELAGATNLGTAFGIGQIAFVVALVVLLLRG